MSYCHRLTPYIEVLPQMANKYNHLAICLACIEFNDRVYALDHRFTNTKKSCKNHLGFLKKNTVKMHYLLYMKVIVRIKTIEKGSVSTFLFVNTVHVKYKAANHVVLQQI